MPTEKGKHSAIAVNLLFEKFQRGGAGSQGCGERNETKNSLQNPAPPRLRVKIL